MTWPYLVFSLLVVAVMVAIAWWDRRPPVPEATGSPADVPEPAVSPEVAIHVRELATRVTVLEEEVEAQGRRIEAAARSGPVPEVPDRRLRESIEAEVARQVEGLSRPAPVSDPAAARDREAPSELGDEARVRALLLAEGFPSPVVLGPGRHAGEWRVEASRGGIVHKGIVRLRADGVGTLHLHHGLRAFP